MPKPSQLSNSKRRNVSPETVERLRRDLAGMEQLMTMQLKLLRTISETLARWTDKPHTVRNGHS
ncbi:MAG: hypothetical protein KDA88_05595 [Planctomycetaceae bacterium]|nr:hypothetical protein [Planctomycetaceae bacterium]